MTNIKSDQLLTALADPTRRQVLEHLRTGPLSVAEIAAQMPVSRPAVSQHLKVLSDAGLLKVEAQGNRRIYAVDVEGLAPLRRWLESFWEDVLKNFAAEVENRTPEQ